MSSSAPQPPYGEEESLTAAALKRTKVSQEEIKSAFAFLDVDKSGLVSLANLKKRLGIFFPDMTPKEFKFLMNNRKELTIEDLGELLAENEISDADFDPVAEAFKVRIKNSGTIKRDVAFLSFSTAKLMVPPFKLIVGL